MIAVVDTYVINKKNKADNIIRNDRFANCHASKKRASPVNGRLVLQKDKKKEKRKNEAVYVSTKSSHSRSHLLTWNEAVVCFYIHTHKENYLLICRTSSPRKAYCLLANHSSV